MSYDARTRLIWRVRATLGPAGHLLLANAKRNPAVDAALRRELVDAIAFPPAAGDRAWADDRGLLAHAPGQLVHEPYADVVSWQQVWDLVSAGITPDRVDELNAAWRDGAAARAVAGDHTDMRLHMACCAFYDPPPPAHEQLDLLDLIGARAA